MKIAVGGLDGGSRARPGWSLPTDLHALVNGGQVSVNVPYPGVHTRKDTLIG